VVSEQLDLREIENEYLEERGQPPYSPVMMTGLIVYGYTQGVYSSRRLGKACEERVDFMVVTGMSRPDFRTISAFRLKHLEALKGLFKQVVQLCMAAKMVKLGHVALDGTKIRANASKDANKEYKTIKSEQDKIRHEIDEWFKQAEHEDEAEDELYGEDKRGDELPEWVSNKEERLKRLGEAKAEIERKAKDKKDKRNSDEESGKKPKSHHRQEAEPKPDTKHNFTDPDSKMMKTRGAFEQCYNAQAAVDSNYQVIVACDVSGEGHDYDQLETMVKQVEQITGNKIQELSADAGYCSDENIKVLEDLGIRGYIALGHQWDAALPLRKKPPAPCTPRARMSTRLKLGGKRSRYRLRKGIVEPVFGVVKAVRAFRQFLLRLLDKAKAEWAMICTAHNIVKLWKVTG